jgi:hypothetical protein
MCLIHYIGGAFTHTPQELSSKISQSASDLIKRAFDDIDLHECIVIGSDYPLRAINVLIRTRPLVKHGYITAKESNLLKENYRYNPLLFDFVLKRTIRRHGTERRLPASVFMTNSALGV